MILMQLAAQDNEEIDHDGDEDNDSKDKDDDGVSNRNCHADAGICGSCISKILAHMLVSD